MTNSSKPRKSRQNPAVREFILEGVTEYKDTIAARAAKEFGLSRTAINRYMQRLLEEGLLEASGQTSGRKYSLKELKHFHDRIPIVEGMYEDDVWRERVLPQMKNVPPNILDICHYGFTEMFNNVIDHSGSPDARIFYTQNFVGIQIIVSDSGVGIFEKIQRDFNLPDPRTALLELSKGKLTSDKTKHSGEGIFFTSRMFQRFMILSGNLGYRKQRLDGDEWLIETDDMIEREKGTAVIMEIPIKAPWTAKQVFDQHQDDEYRFTKTHIPISLAKYGSEQLVSRSQAKRLLARFDRFAEVLLDFQGIENIGQAFADEIFRVYKNAHPAVSILSINTVPDVKRMIDRATGQKNSEGS